MKLHLQRLRPFSGPAVIAILCAAPLFAQNIQYGLTGQQIPAPACLTPGGLTHGRPPPCTALTHQDWLAEITRGRAERRIRIGYDPSRYDLPALKWTQSSFIQPQMMG